MLTHKEWQKIGKHNKQHGYRAEKKVVEVLKELGLPAQRVPLSGATDFQKGDVLIGDPLMRNNISMEVEVKRREKGFSTVFNLYNGNDSPVLAIYTPNKGILFVMDPEEFSKLYKRAAANEH